jgi:hypothetical protein
MYFGPMVLGPWEDPQDTGSTTRQISPALAAPVTGDTINSTRSQPSGKGGHSSTPFVVAP